MSTRKITQVQFSDGTTADGSRIDQALQNGVDRFNGLLPSDIFRRRTQSSIIFGYEDSRISPPVGSQPWQIIYNDDKDFFDPAPVDPLNPKMPPTFSNPWRWKGTNNPNISPPLVADGTQLVWEVSAYFGLPSRLDSLTLFACTDAAYVNIFQKADASPIDDIVLMVQIDDNLRTEARLQDSQEVLRKDFKATSVALIVPGAFASDMQPANPGGPAAGLFIRLDDLRVDIPEYSRVRLGIVLPAYLNPADTSWTAYPWSTARWSGTAVFSEPNA